MQNFKAIYSTAKYSNIEYAFQAKSMVAAKRFEASKFSVKVKIVKD